MAWHFLTVPITKDLSWMDNRDMVMSQLASNEHYTDWCISPNLNNLHHHFESTASTCWRLASRTGEHSWSKTSSPILSFTSSFDNIIPPQVVIPVLQDCFICKSFRVVARSLSTSMQSSTFYCFNDLGNVWHSPRLQLWEYLDIAWNQRWWEEVHNHRKRRATYTETYHFPIQHDFKSFHHSDTVSSNA